MLNYYLRKALKCAGIATLIFFVAGCGARETPIFASAIPRDEFQSYVGAEKVSGVFHRNQGLERAMQEMGRVEGAAHYPCVRDRAKDVGDYASSVIHVYSADKQYCGYYSFAVRVNRERIVSNPEHGGWAERTFKNAVGVFD